MRFGGDSSYTHLDVEVGDCACGEAKGRPQQTLLSHYGHSLLWRQQGERTKPLLFTRPSHI